MCRPHEHDARISDFSGNRCGEVSPAAGQRPSLGEAGGGLDADARPARRTPRGRALRRTCRRSVRRSRSRRRGPRRRAAPGPGTSARRRCPPRRAPCGPGRRRCRSTCGWPPHGPRPSRSSPCRAGRRSRPCRSPGDSCVPANQDPIITWEAPAARASATSRGCRTPPSAQTCLPCRRAASTHSTTALNCGRPTPVIIRVVHIAPGPTPTLTMSAPASIRSCTPSADDHVAGDDRAPRVDRAYGGERLDHPLLVAVGGVDDEAVDPHRRAAAWSCRPRRR